MSTLQDRIRASREARRRPRGSRRTHQVRQQLEAAIEAAVAALDALDGDPDLEEEPDLEEGWDRELVDECEPETGDCCNWQDEGDQTALRQLPVHQIRRPRPRHSVFRSLNTDHVGFAKRDLRGILTRRRRRNALPVSPLN